MTLNEAIWAEVQQEASNTRKILERVPFEKGDFKPHEKSMTLKGLAKHVAEISGWSFNAREIVEILSPNISEIFFKVVLVI